MKSGLWIAVAATVILVVATYSRDDAQPSVVAAVPSGKALPSSTGDSRATNGPTRRPLPGVGTDIFAVPLPPGPAPPVVSAPSAPPPPQRPPFPYEYFGRLTNLSGGHDTYLQRDGDLIPLLAGASLDAGYVVDSVTEGQVVIRHQPTGDVVRIDLPSFRQ